MPRHVVLGASAALLLLGLAGCAKQSDTAGSRPSPGAVPMLTAAPTGSVTPARAETIFLDATAAHLCAVQGRVYTDPGELASAYQTPPPYPDLTQAQVDAFTKRITTDSAFATRLTDTVRKTCGAAPTPS